MAAERKTDEIKFRIEPSRKAAWQQTAADEEIGLSKLIVRAVEQYRRDLATGGDLFRVGDVVVADFAADSTENFSVAPDPAPTKNAQGAWQGNWTPWGGDAA